jgi:hypothetical protein
MVVVYDAVKKKRGAAEELLIKMIDTKRGSTIQKMGFSFPIKKINRRK